MPEQISVSNFVKETWDDYNSPTTSNFVSRMGQCRNTVSALEETLDYDRSGLTKMKKSVKALYSSGSTCVSNEKYLAENLEKLGASALHRENESDIGAAFVKFAVVTKELSALMKNLMQNLNNILMFPLDSFLKGDLRGVKGDLKKPFDKAWKEYDTKFNKIEKEKKSLAKEAGMLKTEVTGPEVAEDMEKERRMFQLQMTEYLIKVNEIKTKKGLDLLQHLVEYYQAQNNYFQDGLKTIEHFRCYIEELVTRLGKIKLHQDQERRQLIELRDALKSSMSNYKETPSTTSGYSLHQLQGNKVHGCEKSGYLLKKSEGMRKVWQKRKCIIKDSFLSISHSDLTKEPVRLNLLTCQVKLVHDDPGKKCFDLISSSKNRTYHFQADDTSDMEQWISVLNNAKEAVLMKAFGESAGPESSPINQSVKELTRTIITEVCRLPGNRSCCDCGAPDPEWLSVNLGVLICLECCGVHREMGVHISRTQSIVIDELGTSQLLLARVVSNRGFNDIMEATLDIKLKPTPTSDMEDRKEFIRAKYEKRRYAIVTCTNVDDRRQDLKQAVLCKDIFALLQVFAEGIDFMEPLPDMPNRESALHLAIMEEDGTSLPMVDFILQNSNSQHLSRLTKDGNSVLHICAKYNQIECMKLLLRVRPDLVDIENNEDLTALEIAKDNNNDLCADLLNNAISGKTDLFENVNIDWNLISDDHLFDIDYSDDDLDGGMQTPGKTRSRPGSLVMASESTLPLPRDHQPHRERASSADSTGKPGTLPPPPPPQSNKPKWNTMTLPHNSANPHQMSLSMSSSMTSSSSSQMSGMATLPKKKAPAPPPPGIYRQHGHVRNPSDPGLQTPRTHVRTPSDPPPLPIKMGLIRSHFPGGKLVLPPPPEFREKESSNASNNNPPFSIPTRPVPVPRKSTPSSTPTEEKSFIPLSNQILHNRVNGQSRSSDSLESTDSNSTTGKMAPPPVPTPRQKRKNRKIKRCRALYDCEADNEDELSFQEGEMIIVLREEEDDWWEGHIEESPDRRGMFPKTFVELVNSD